MLTATSDMALPPLSAQRAYLICYQALRLKDGGMRNFPLLPHHCSPTGSSHLHQTAGEIQREAQALHGVCVLLLHSDRDRWGLSGRILNRDVILHSVHINRRQVIQYISLFHSQISPEAILPQ